MSVHVSEEAAQAAAPKASFLRYYIDYCNGQTHAPTAFHVATGLAALATLVPPMFGLEAPNGHLRRPHLYVLLVGDAGFSRRTTSLSLMSSILQHAVPHRFCSPAPETWRKVFRHLRKSAAPQATVMEPEHGRYFYTRRGEAHLSTLCEWYIDAYSGPGMGFASGKDSVSLPWVAPTLVGGATAAEIEHAMRRDFRWGLWSRFLVLRGEPREWLDQPDRLGAVKRAYLQKMAQFYSTRAASMGAVRLGEDAAEFHAERSRVVHESARGWQHDDPIRSVIAWNHDLAMRIAMLLAFDDTMYVHWQRETTSEAGNETAAPLDRPPAEISVEILQRAWHIVDLHLAGADSLVRSVHGPIRLATPPSTG